MTCIYDNPQCSSYDGTSVKVLVYANAERVELFLNGKPQGMKPVDIAMPGKLPWSVPFALGTPEARASRGGEVVAADKVETAGAAAALAPKADRDKIVADGRDLAFVGIDVVDVKGIVVPQDSNEMDFALEGPGKLAGVDSGNPISHESYQVTSRSAFSDKALAIIHSTVTPGTITLKANSGSLVIGQVTITIAAPWRRQGQSQCA